MNSDDLILCRSDKGDGGWSLHAPGSTDEEIATAEEPYLTSGEATWDEERGAWDRPNQADYAEARMVLAARTTEPARSRTESELRDAIIALSEALDPQHQGACWPDPIEWDGRPLRDQTRDLLAAAEAHERDATDGNATMPAADAVRAILAREDSGRS